MAAPGKLEITIKINEMPKVRNVDNGWKEFYLSCDGQIVTVKVKPKVYKKLEDAQANYPMWVAAISGKLGARTKDGFILDSPAIQVFERKPKEPKPEQEILAG